MIENAIILAVLILLSGFFSGTEVALVSIGKIRARTLLREKRRGAKSLYKLKQNPERMIITILIGNNIVNVAAAAIATVIATDYFGSAGLGIATGVMTFLLLVFGEITPKTLSAKHSTKIALIVAKPILIMSYILYPVISVFEWFSKISAKLVKLKESPMTEEELKVMIEYTAEKNIIDLEEKKFLESVLQFNDIRAEEVMTPKDKIFSLDSKMTVKKSLKELSRSKYSRIPLYSGRKNNITGIVHIRDILANLGTNKKLKDIDYEPVIVAHNLTLDNIFKIFQLNQAHMAMVVDSNRKVIGILTLEDIMEELVGEIMDEKDLTPTTIIRIDKRTIVVHGETLIERINKFFRVNIPSIKGVANISDFIKYNTKKFGKGSKITMDDLVFIIDGIEDGDITKVRIMKKKRLVERIGEAVKK